ncbi:MAG: hypothetical protein AB1765_03460 [Candidatus Hydrogenedentota bacterium]
MLSINEMSRLFNRGCDSALLIGNFLDEFKNAADEDRRKSVQKPPVNTKGNKSSYLAAMVEQLCLEYKLDIPAWVNDKKYFLKEPVFYTAFENLKTVLIQESPVPFRRRNIFVSGNALDRV